MRSVCFLAFAALFAGCGDPAPPSDPPTEDTAAPAAAEAEAPAAAEAETEVPTAPVPEAAAPPTPAGPPIDLLHATRTSIRVSSVYENRQEQVARLVDGELDTAWNSGSGDLVAAFIDFQVPAEATVTSIELTAGFTRTGGQTDLFTGNHRVARVRVAREGQVLGRFELDTNSRALQPLAVSGPGGAYRVEVLEVLPGSRDDWQEICVSELRVMGTLAGAEAGSASPDVGVGALTRAPPAEPQTTATTEGAAGADATQPVGPGPAELEGVTLEVHSLGLDTDSESLERGRRMLSYPTVAHPNPRIRRQLDARLRAGAIATAARSSPPRWGLEVSTDCTTVLATDVLVSVTCMTTEYEDAGETERIGGYHLEVRNGRVREIELADLFGSSWALEPLLAQAGSGGHTRRCNSDGCNYAVVADYTGLTVTDDSGNPVSGIPYEATRAHLAGDGTLASLFLRDEEED